ncbi:Dihydrofolate synthase/folylpolyglutamate synthase [Nymphon striatum]|nr:Dihydrofolate synthase/folylpolyglutamate synthase [Nymphon striatum]
MKRSLSEWLNWQEKLHLSEIDLGLERIGKVAKELGILDPPFTIITVAGTNGKGSSVAILESILRSEGYKTGAYTSPHLIHYNERIAVNNTPLNDEKICSAFEEIDEARKNVEKEGEISLTYFEFGTLAAILSFIEEKVDVAILEVGLGGRLDAANLWDASLAIITGIAIDHVSWLGNDREKIAIEKSGIMRKQRPVICGDPNPPTTIKSEAARIGARLYQIDENFSYKIPSLDVSKEQKPRSEKANNSYWEWKGWMEEHTITLPKPSLSGDFQFNNAATDYKNISIPGRMQIIQKEPEWLVDVAHNPQSAEQLANYLRDHPVKDVSRVVSLMEGFIQEWHLVNLQSSRGIEIDVLKDKVKARQVNSPYQANIYQYDDFQKACHHLKKTTKNEDRNVFRSRKHMDQSMVKRGIGAMVLAVIAALLLGYLLKDKSRERQEVVDMKLPGTTEMNIPDLGGSTETNTAQEESISLVGEAGNAVNQVGAGVNNAVIASANAVKNTVSDAGQAINNSVDTNNPGFSIRPPSSNETREITDTRINDASDGSGSAAIAYSTDPVDEVIASNKTPKKKFKPSIVEEKRVKPKSAAKKATKKPAPKQVAKKPTPKKETKKTASKAPGKYSIQLLATSSQSRASKLAKSMKSEGYKVFVTETKSNNKVLFRVRVGGHAGRSEAVTAQEGMKRRYQKNFFVQNSLVVSN